MSHLYDFTLRLRVLTLATWMASAADADVVTWAERFADFVEAEAGVWANLRLDVLEQAVSCADRGDAAVLAMAERMLAFVRGEPTAALA